MARIGVISLSDGRDYVHGGIVGFIRMAERLVTELTVAGHTVIRGVEPIGRNDRAVTVARQVAAAGIDLTVLHYAVWAFPHFTMLAAGGALDQIGREHARLWGDPADPELIAAIGDRARAAAAASHEVSTVS